MPGSHDYFFGDYYDPAYARRGYEPWVDHRFGKNAYDPLFSYYRWKNRGDARWETNLRSVYTARRDNAAVRPARTLIEQERDTGRPKAVVHLSHVQPTALKLDAVTKAHVEQIHKNTQEFRNLSQERGRLEVHVKSPPPREVKAPPRIQLPQRTIVHPPVIRQPPPHPVHPKPAPRRK